MEPGRSQVKGRGKPAPALVPAQGPGHGQTRAVGLESEARRVARRAIVVKDHRTSRPLARPTLRVMDWIGNRPHGVPLPYNYWSEARWRAAWKELELRIEHYQTRLDLYPGPARWIFESGLHFLAKLGVS